MASTRVEGNLSAVDGDVTNPTRVDFDVKAKAKAIHDNLQEYVDKVESSYIVLGELLYAVYTEQLYRYIEPGFDSFNHYVEETLKMSPRRARYLMSIWWWVGIKQKADPILVAICVDLGWSKAKDLVEVIDKQSAMHWYAIARLNGQRGFAKLVRESLEESGRRRKSHRLLLEDAAKLDPVDLSAIPTIDIDKAVAAIADLRAIPDSALKQFIIGHETESKPKLQVIDGGLTTGETELDYQEALAGEPVSVDEDASEQEREPRVQDVYERMKRTLGSEDDGEPSGVIPPDRDKMKEMMEKSALKNEVLRISMVGDQIGVIKEAIEVAKKIAGTDHDGNALALVCMSFLADQNKASLDDFLAQIEERHAVSLIALKKHGGGMDVVYGHDTLMEMANDGSDGTEVD